MSTPAHPGPNGDRVPASSLLTTIAVAIVAYAAADVVHELIGHALVARIQGVEILSISSVALQTGRSSRAVAAAGTLADVVAGAIVFALLARHARFDARHCCLWLFGCVSFMNSGYLIVSGLLESGDWAVVIAGLNPPWVWRLGVMSAGIVLYVVAIRLAAYTAGKWVAAGEVSIADFRRVTRSSYVTGGVLLMLAAALNPIGIQLVLISGAGASFGLTWGLLLIPNMLASRAGGRPPAPKVLAFQAAWVVAALVVAVAFVGILGPGIRLSR